MLSFGNERCSDVFAEFSWLILQKRRREKMSLFGTVSRFERAQHHQGPGRSCLHVLPPVGRMRFEKEAVPRLEQVSPVLDVVDDAALQAVDKLVPLRLASDASYFSMAGFHTFHTLPTRSGPGLRVGSPGIQPAGVASVPLLVRTSWNA